MSQIPLFRNALLLVAFLICIIASTYKLTEAPAIWYDEGFYTQIAMNVAHFGTQEIQTAPDAFEPTTYITVGYPLIWPLALSYKVFGVGVLQGRAVMVIFILGFACFSYLLLRRLFGSLDAAWMLMMLATFPMLYGNGKPVLGEVPGLMYCLLALYTLRRLEETQYRDWRLYALLGLTAGLCAATKPLFLLLLAALFITLLVRWKKIRINWWGALAGAAALAGALGIWIWLQFGSDASLGSVLGDYANPYAAGNVPALITTNALRFIKESTPLYTLLLMVAWSAALFLRRKKSTVSSAEIAAYAFCILTMLSYLRLEGWYRYLFPATMVSLLFLPASLAAIASAIAARMPRLPRMREAAYAFLLLLALGQFYQTAHASYVAQYYSGTRTRDMSAFLATLGGKSVLLYNVPELAILLPTSSPYYQYLSPTPLIIMGSENLGKMAQGAFDVLITDSGTYASDAAGFGPYTSTTTVDKYVILYKK